MFCQGINHPACCQFAWSTSRAEFEINCRAGASWIELSIINNIIGIYSSGHWLRRYLGHIDVELDQVKWEEYLLNLIIEYTNFNKKVESKKPPRAVFAMRLIGY